MSQKKKKKLRQFIEHSVPGILFMILKRLLMPSSRAVCGQAGRYCMSASIGGVPVPWRGASPTSGSAGAQFLQVVPGPASGQRSWLTGDSLQVCPLNHVPQTDFADVSSRRAEVWQCLPWQRRPVVSCAIPYSQLILDTSRERVDLSLHGLDAELPL